MRRLAHSVFVLLGLVVVVFFVTHSLGDPARLMLRPEATEEQVQALRDTLGLNDPILVQFGRYMANLVRGDFGDSIWQRVPALPIVLDRIPATLYLAGVTLAVSLPLAVCLGVISAIRPRSLADRVVTVVSLTGVSTADFWLGLMLILLFAVELKILPASGRGPTASIFGVPFAFFTWEGLRHLILPAFTLALYKSALVIRIAQAGTREVMLQDYIRFARAKGLSQSRIVGVHVLKNIMIPVVTVLGLELGSMIAFAVVTETVFAYPGMGKLLIDSINRLDRPIIVAYLMLTVVIFVVINLIVDLLYATIDPRVRLADAKG